MPMKVTDLLVKTSNPKVLDQTVLQIGGAVIQDDDIAGTYKQVDGCYIVRCFADPGFMSFAINHQGYGEVVGQREVPPLDLDKMRQATERVNDLFFEKLGAYDPNHPWTKKRSRVREVPMPIVRILINRVRCRHCHDVIESRSQHDLVWCSCGTVAVDGGRSYLKRLGDRNAWEELSEWSSGSDPAGLGASLEMR